MNLGRFLKMRPNGEISPNLVTLKAMLSRPMYVTSTDILSNATYLPRIDFMKLDFRKKFHH
jgi:hypothetical protein